MGVGWNLGNTLDACNYKKEYLGEAQAVTYYEKLWGNPVTTAAMIKAIHDAGFGSIRVPVTYYDHLNKDGTIEADWFDRVATIVDDVLAYDMYCIIDVHHDSGLCNQGSWLVCDTDKRDTTIKNIKNLWTQIANRFQNYNYKLIFEGLNEIVDTNKNYSWDVGEQFCHTINDLNQAFVDAVRATGGNNAERLLAVSTFGAITDEQKLKFFTMPKDSTKNKIMLALHDYTTSADGISKMFTRIKKYCTDKGIPVILDEFGSEKNFGSETQRAESAANYVRQATALNIACYWWDNGNPNEYGIFDRYQLQWQYPALKDALIAAAKLL